MATPATTSLPAGKPRATISNWRRRLTRRGFLAALAALPATAAADCFYWEPTWLKVRTIRLNPSPSVRIAQFSDLHYRGDARYLQKVVDQINALAPDITCFTGDIIEDEEYLEGALKLFSGIRSPLYGVPGNHDYWSHADFEVIESAFAAARGRWLMDEQIELLHGKLTLTGASCSNQRRFAPRPGSLNLTLIHYPVWVDYLEPGFDLILAGHSHGGQVRVPLLGAPVLPFNVGGYDLGMFRTHAGPLYVNPGIGYFYIDVRFRCRPEITLFEL